MMRKLIIFFPVMCVVLLLSNCQSAGKMNGSETTVTGTWSGTWWYGDKVDEGQPLSCTCEQIGANQWTATFDAQYGGRSLYTFDITGKRVGDAVMFEGAVDLGQDQGGVYHWKGEARGETFTGEYTSTRTQGAFKMSRSLEG
jgi:hypothetical protein